MHSALYNLAHWDQLCDADCIDIARSIEAALPAVTDVELVRETYGYGVRRTGSPVKMTFHSVEKFSLGDQSHFIARFQLRGSMLRTFSLIPGGTVTLGYDRHSQRYPAKRHETEWNENLERYPELPPLRQQIDQTMTPLRIVTLHPFLIEDCTIGCERDDDTPAEHEHVVSGLMDAGFSLPTSDQWEYAYSSGTRCMFPWGDMPWPEYSSNEFESNFRENAFGLVPTTDCYAWELCREPEITRGGDGGGAVCSFGGMLYEMIWACPFFLNMDCERYFARFRRVLTLEETN